MAKSPDTPKKSGKTAKSKAPSSKAPSSKASRPDVQPIGPALAELLNPAINRGDAGIERLDLLQMETEQETMVSLDLC